MISWTFFRFWSFFGDHEPWVMENMLRIFFSRCCHAPGHGPFPNFLVLKISVGQCLIHSERAIRSVSTSLVLSNWDESIPIVGSKCLYSLLTTGCNDAVSRKDMASAKKEGLLEQKKSFRLSVSYSIVIRDHYIRNSWLLDPKWAEMA